MSSLISEMQQRHQGNHSLIHCFMESVGTEEWLDMLHDDIIFHFPNAPFMGGKSWLMEHTFSNQFN